MSARNLVGFVGWRGMVGSVLMDRMQAEGDFELIESVFFSTSNVGGDAPAFAGSGAKLQDAMDIAAFKRCDIIVTAQGGDYTSEVFGKLRADGWNGHWIDAASTLRMQDDAVIILDPVNLPVIQNALVKGGRNWIGGNCTVSCMLMGVGALFKAGPGRVDDLHDLPGRIRRWRAAHARVADPVRDAERRGTRPAGRPQVRHPGDRPQGAWRASNRCRRQTSPISACRWAAA